MGQARPRTSLAAGPALDILACRGRCDAERIRGKLGQLDTYPEPQTGRQQVTPMSLSNRLGK